MAGLGDVELVPHLGVELVEVRTAGRVFVGNGVHDQCDKIGFVRADERVDVGQVRVRVTGDHRRFAMTGRAGQGSAEESPRQQTGCCGEAPNESERTLHC